MFICEECLTKKGIKEKYEDCGRSILFMSHGRCEECGKPKDCYEVYIH